MEVRPIDANQIHYTRCLADKGLDMELAAKCVIDKIPTLDYAPIRHGEWEKNTADAGWFRELLFCSVCGVGTLPYPTKYCPSCGAKMDGGQKE